MTILFRPEIWRNVEDEINLNQVLKNVINLSNECMNPTFIYKNIENDLDKF
jgi:hypothetical protein